MGKGNYKTKKAKIFKGSYGNTRRKPKQHVYKPKLGVNTPESSKSEDVLTWFSRKKYLHFSPRIRDAEWAQKIVSDEDRIAKHNFYPLIHRIVKQRRYKKFVVEENKKKKEYRSHYDKGKREPTTKIRHIFYANHLDAAIYSYYAKQILSPLYEIELKNNGISECVSAYRNISVEEGSNKGKSNIHFAHDIFQYIKSREECVALAFDITGFFDNLDHLYLKEIWSNLLGESNSKLPPDHQNLYRSITNFSFVPEKGLLKMFDLIKYKDPSKRRKKAKNLGGFYRGKNRKERERFFREKICKKGLIRRHNKYEEDIAGVGRGIPQGLPISALLANLYLMEYDTEINNFIRDEVGGIYRRYSDDILIVCPIKYKSCVEKRVESLMKNPPFKLKINPEKTVVVNFYQSENSEGLITEDNKKLKYLGFEFDGVNTFVKSSSLSKYHRRKKNHIKRRVQMTNDYQAFKGEKQNVWTSVIKKKYLQDKGRNFISYLKSATITMGEPNIFNQVRKRGDQLKKYLEKRLVDR